MIQRKTFILLSGSILLVYLLILQRYGTAIPAPISPEEINFAGLARNIAEGKGPVFAIPSELVPNPTLNPRRVYTPVLSYAFALSAWGKIWGFDLLPLRWFNRILGALNILLLIGLARRWGVPRGLALLAAFWTSMDILFQLNGNIIRSDMFSLLWVLLGLIAFTHERESRKAGWLWASGLCFAIALFAHFLEASLLFLGILGILLLERRWKEAASFLCPSALAGLGWFLYALQDWEWFLTTSHLAVNDRILTGWEEPLLAILGALSTLPVLGAYPDNSPLWLPILLSVTWAKFRNHLKVSSWIMGMLWMAYLTGYTHASSFYSGWFSPFGYLALVLLVQVFTQEKKWTRRSLLVLAILWSGYQSIQVGKCWQAAPAIQQAHQAFFQELATELPLNGSFWLQSVPDPYFFLSRTRPDLTLYVGSGYYVVKDFLQQTDGGIFALGFVHRSLVFSNRIRREWHIPGVIDEQPIFWVEPLR